MMRYRLIGVALLWLIVLGVAAYARKPERPPMRRFLLDCMLREIGKDGQKKVMATPCLMTQDSQAAKFMEGGELSVILGTGNDREVEYVPFGFSAEIKARTLKNGKVVLDVNIQDTQAEQALEGVIGTRSNGAHFISTVDFGDRTTFKLPREKGGTYLFEVRVRDGDDTTNRP
jgi:hypothetical protein